MVYFSSRVAFREGSQSSTCVDGGNEMKKWESSEKMLTKWWGHLSILMLDSKHMPGARKTSTEYLGQRLRAAYDSLSLRIWAKSIILSMKKMPDTRRCEGDRSMEGH